MEACEFLLLSATDLLYLMVVIFIVQVSFNITLTTFMCTDELMNGIDWLVKIPGFGEFEVELTGVCDCSCINNPVRCLI